jgi:very-short-patch-repair endonuclease
MTKKGHKNSEEHNNNIRKAMLGIKYPEERRKNISNSLKGKKLSEETKKNMSLGKLEFYKTHKGTRFGIITSEETKLKLRNAQINYIKNTQNFRGPNVGKFEKLILDIIQNKIGFSIKRGFYINGYFLDGYCQELNLAIEIDEEYHYRNNILRQKDIEKQNNIIKSLNCSFLRIRVSKFLNNEINLGETLNYASRN